MNHLVARVQKVSACLVNTATDPGVMFGIGNTILNWDSGGSLGAVVNMAATTVGIGLRLNAEIRKHFNLAASHTKLGQWAENSTSSLKTAGYAQLAVGAIAAASGDYSTAASSIQSAIGAVIPLSFGAGNLASARIAEKGKNAEASALTVMSRDMAYTLGLSLASGPAAYVTTPVFIGSALYSGWKARQGEDSAVPLTGLAGGNALSAVVNYAAGHIGPAAATGLFGAGYASILCQKYGGVWETAHAVTQYLFPQPRVS